MTRSGGWKDDSGKGRYDLIPPRPLRALAEVFTIGAEKYGDRNWEQGIAFGRIFAAMMRHGWAWWSGERDDPEDGQHHLSSVAWCAMALMELEQTHPELDDRPHSIVEKAPRPVSMSLEAEVGLPRQRVTYKADGSPNQS